MLVLEVLYIMIQRRQSVYALGVAVTFVQTLYWLTFFEWQAGLNSRFFNGFRYSLLKFFPNFFTLTRTDIGASTTQ